MTVYKENEIENKLKGAIAERIFELFHSELNCIVYKTGQEILYPHLFDVANVKKNYYHNKNYYKSLKAMRWDKDSPYKNMSEKEARNFLDKLRTENTATSEKISSTPDYTVITPKGRVIQFEVKFRKSGELSDEEMEKYKQQHPDTLIFLICPEEPCISVLEYSVDIETANKIIMDFAKLSVENPLFKDEQFKFKFFRTLLKSKFEYRPVKKGSSGSLLIEGEVDLNFFSYPKELLDKYAKLIKKVYSNFDQTDLDKFQ